MMRKHEGSNSSSLFCRDLHLRPSTAMEYERDAFPVEFMKFCSTDLGVFRKPLRECLLLAPIRISTKTEPIVEDDNRTIPYVIGYEFEYRDS